VLAVIIAAAVIALLQIGSARSGSASPLSSVAGAIAIAFEEGASAIVSGVRGATHNLALIPSLQRANNRLEARNKALQRENARLNEALAFYREQAALQPQIAQYPRSIEARVIGFPPEYAVQSVTIDKGTRNGIARDDGVLAADGVVGRVMEAGPFSSKVTLITDFTSTIPAVVAQGRYWGIARGNESSVRLEYISQDAPLRVGQEIVTGEARSFHSGALIGTIVGLERSATTLYQTAIVKPSVDFSRLERVVVVPK